MKHFKVIAALSSFPQFRVISLDTFAEMMK